jgi:hypothetical protein
LTQRAIEFGEPLMCNCEFWRESCSK